jgi:nucleoside-diphosphate-sugar epimerase
MRVLVTGHLGYLGPAVVGTLLAEGHDVTGLDSGLFSSCVLEREPDIATIFKDVRDVEVADLFGYDAIVHLAALSNDPMGFLDPARTNEVNALATVRLASLARDAGVGRFLQSSSCSVYGAPAEPWVDEASRPMPVTPYGVSKVTAERGLSELASPDFCVVSLRNATAFGYTSRLRTDLVVNDFVSNAYLRREVRLNSDGSAWRPLVHAQDIARAFSMALLAPAELINGAVFNVGEEEQNYTVLQIAQAVLQAVPGATLSMSSGAPTDQRSYRVRFDRLHQLLPAFRCQYRLEDGIRDLLSNLRRVGFDSSAGHSRIEHLQTLMRQGDVDENLRLRAPLLAASRSNGKAPEPA